MTARIGYLAALAGDEGRPRGGGGPVAGGERAALWPPRRVFGTVGFSDAGPSVLEAPGFADDPGIAGLPGNLDGLTARADASGARIIDPSAGNAAPGQSGPPRPASSPEPRPASTAAGRTRASDHDGGDTGREFVIARADPPAPAREYLDDVHEERRASPSEADPRARPSGDAQPAAPGQPSVSADAGRADIPAHPGAREYPLSPSPSADGHQPAPDRAGRGSASASRKPGRRPPGEPWRIARLGQPQPQPARDHAAAPAVLPSAVTDGPSAPPHVAAPATGPPAAEPPPGALPPSRRSRPAGNATALDADRLPSVPPADAHAAAPPPIPGSPPPGAAGLPAPIPSAARHPRVLVAATANSASPLPDAQPPSALAEAFAPSAAQSSAASLPAAPFVGSAESAPRPAADRAQARLTPSASHVGRPAGSRAETAARPSTPTLSIGMIEVTLLPPPPAPAPARTARREPPPRLSRGLGRRFGQGQA